MSDDAPSGQAWDALRGRLRAEPRRWLVTGAAGFVGSHLVEALLALGQTVIGLDNFSTGHLRNLEAVRREVGPEGWLRFSLIEGDIRDRSTCAAAVAGVDRVLHQAALGSVPRSLERPQDTHATNVDGFVNMALAAAEAGVGSFVFASSSSVYGDDPALPKVEDRVGQPLSPYAASKRAHEVYAASFAHAYTLPAVGLRYFNVIGPRQDPESAYALVVPKWLALLRRGKRPVIYGDGHTSRDFCPVANVVQANLLAAFAPPEARGRVFNVALGGRTTLEQLFVLLRDGMAARGVACAGVQPRFESFRRGDMRHSLADITAAKRILGYVPTVDLQAGLDEAMDWMLGRVRAAADPGPPEASAVPAAPAAIVAEGRRTEANWSSA